MQPSATSIALRPGRGDLHLLYPWFAALAEVHGLSDSQVFGVQLVLEEAATNAALHGFEPGQDGAISIKAKVAPEAVTLVLQDDGKPFDPTAVPESAVPGTLEAAEIGGRGLRLIRRYCSAMSYRREGDENEFTMVIPLSAQAAGR